MPKNYGELTSLSIEEQRPFVEYGGVDKYPVLSGEKININVFSKYNGDYSALERYDDISYRVFIKSGNEEYEEITKGYTRPIPIMEEFSLHYDKNLEAGLYEILIFVKKANYIGQYNAKYGDYDNLYNFKFNCYDRFNKEYKVSEDLPGNIVNNGLAVEDENFIYYVNRIGDIYGTSTDCLYRIKKNRNEKELSNLNFNTRLIEDRVWNLYIVDNWIYYSNWINPFKHGIYRVDIDGKNRRLIANEPVSNMVVRGNWIYYIRMTNYHSVEKNNIYKISIDGSCRIQLTQDAAEDMAISGDWIYYVNKMDKYKPYRVKIDGSERQKICDDETLFMTVYKDTIYYSNYEDECKLYKIHMGSNEKTKLIDDKVSFFNVFENKIYYVNELDNGALYLFNTNNGKKIKLTNIKGSNIIILKDMIYYGGIFYNNKHYIK
jgi:hypothetical protein